MAEYIGDMKIEPDDPVVVDEDFDGQEIYAYQTYFVLDDEKYTEDKEEDFLEKWLKRQDIEYLEKLTHEQLNHADLKDILIDILMDEDHADVLERVGAWVVKDD